MYIGLPIILYRYYDVIKQRKKMLVYNDAKHSNTTANNQNNNYSFFCDENCHQSPIQNNSNTLLYTYYLLVINIYVPMDNN